MDIVNDVIEGLVEQSDKEEWVPVIMNVADATVTVIKEQVSSQIINFKYMLCGVYYQLYCQF